MPDPVAWIEIEPGWKVFDKEGNEVGRVREVRGDLQLDIFDGLTVKKGILSKDRYVPAEHIAAIYEAEIHLSITRDEIEALANG